MRHRISSEAELSKQHVFKCNSTFLKQNTKKIVFGMPSFPYLLLVLQNWKYLKQAEL